MNRREFVKAASLGTAALATQGCFGASRGSRGRERNKPNLLFIWTDEQRADTMAAYGNANIHTPNLNKLAKESVVFENAYVTQVSMGALKPAINSFPYILNSLHSPK